MLVVSMILTHVLEVITRNMKTEKFLFIVD
jgi:hypothetical protein